MGPLIAVVGSASPQRSYEPPLADVAQMISAAESLGRELAINSFRIAVFSSHPDFIESSVVKGYIGSGSAELRSIEVHSRFGKEADFAEIIAFRDCFDVRPDPGDDWEVGYYRALLSADGVLIIGGGRSAFTAGLIAISRGIPIVAAASLGGAAQRVWRRFAEAHDLVSDEDAYAMAEAWQAQSPTRLVASLSRQCDLRTSRLQEAEAEQQRAGWRATVSLAVGVLFLLLALAAIPLSYSQPPGTALGITALVGAPLLAAGCGAIMRNAFDVVKNWVRTAVLGSAAGAITALLFLAAQLTTTPDILTAEGSRRLLFFILPIGFVSGLTFDAVYSRLRAQDVSLTASLDRSPPA
ncbi:hypothetical protein FAF44_05485 [Nonomuraea sp. MG754425]|uniref:hypothetical protein n=1 Tax=Nonomuraea sp. MG754425 TaxID=2570319 RepID=UPI001F2CC071|nr:hypothetical protein [Nonomuraea sp. MG754425]MCF6467862.1 hypothetical protein [Nonomuraea sp. MG754425]